MEKIKECPFCGSNEAPRIIFDYQNGIEGANGQCCVCCDNTQYGCGGSGSYAETEYEAIKRWNTRTKD